jgi:Mn2+/Fe2+ NRAMP family transporter
VKKFVAVTLGIITAIGGFVDIGDLVANAEVGARFGFSLAWVVALGVVGICVFAEMAGRVAAVSTRPVFDLVRERLGARAALANLVASSFVNFLTLAAEVAGVALALELATSVSYLLWIPLTALAVWLVIWRVQFETMERIFGIAGLSLIAFGVAFWRLGPDWGSVLHAATHPAVPAGEGLAQYLFFAVALFGAAMTPYEVFFFSSGAVEEGWTSADLNTNRANVMVGFPLGGTLSLAIMGTAALVLAPRQIHVGNLAQVALPSVLALGKVGLAFLLIGFFAATFGAALETALSSGYIISQFFGWQWGKRVRPADAPRFHAVVLIAVVLGAMLVLTSIDPITVTEYSLVLSALALPLTYFPILVIANDPDYMGSRTNSKLGNAFGSLFLVVVLLASAAALPLMIITKAGQ